MLLIWMLAVSALIVLGGVADMARLGRKRFADAGKRRWHWVLLMIGFGPLAVLLYAAAVRPQVAHPDRFADLPAEAV